jgi:scyllo-inositol 2-dehydrogenase (NADP+)
MALEAGKLVLVDKPLAMSTAAVDRMMAVADQGRGLLSVFHNRRWDGDFLTVRRILEQGVLGSLHSFEAHWDRYRPLVAERWRERAQHGGGVLLDLGTHLLDQVLALFGTPEWLEADIRCQRPGASVDDAFEIRMGKGALRIVLGASSLSAEPRARFRLDGELGTFSKSGLDVQEQQLRAGLTPLDDAFGQEPSSQCGQLTLGASGARSAVPSERGNWLQVYASLSTCRARGAPPPVQAQEAREGLRLIEAARLSSATGRRVVL